MHVILLEVLTYIQNATRYKWYGIALAWLLCVVGWAYVSQMPDRYQADARVHVDTYSVLRPLLTGLAIHPDVASQVRLMAKVMFSRPNLEKVARMTDMDLNVTSEEGMEKLIKRLQHSAQLTGTTQENLFTISFEDADPKTAKRAVQAFLTIFVEQTIGESREDSASAQKFLDQQLKEYETRLQVAEQAKENFKRTNYGLMPNEGENLYNSLNTLSKQLEDTNMALREAIDRRDELKRQLEELPDVVDFETPTETSINPLDTRLQTLQTKLDELLVKYTKNHPEVIALKRSIADLERQKRESVAAATNEGTEPTISAAETENPIFQQMKIAVTEADANVTSLTTRVKLVEEKIEMLKKQMDDRLKVETQLQGLTRDYETIKVNYQRLVERREQARISESVEQNSDTVKFDVVDPPKVPTKPSGPNRILYYSLVLLASLAMGGGVTIFMSLLRPAFTTVQKLREMTGMPVLGSVSMIWIHDIKRQKWREFLGFMTAFSLLILAYFGVIGMELGGFHLPSFDWLNYGAS